MESQPQNSELGPSIIIASPRYFQYVFNKTIDA